jgi:2-desacetyl-2-hydroxyethyl bacteriochlorophyllide A dehydrogenase
MTAVAAPLEERPLPTPRPADDEVLVRVRAAGICRSDVHYRAGAPSPRALPRTLGHEIAGEVVSAGASVRGLPAGTRVAVNYVLHCGVCDRCRAGRENHCASVGMIGASRDGGYAEYVAVPARNALPIPASLAFEHAAVMMCSTATAYHALRLADLRAGESVCVVGLGGLGASAVELARALGASKVVAVERLPEKRALAATFGAIGVEPGEGLTERLRAATGGRGLDVVIDLVAHAATTHAALAAMAHGGRLVSVALSREPLTLDPYRDLIGRELRVMGSNDHWTTELHELIALAERGAIDLSRVVSRTVALDGALINAVFDAVESGTEHFRTVIRP